MTGVQTCALPIYVLTGRISDIKINPRGQLLVYLKFSGDGGRGWINPQYPRNIKVRTYLYMEGKGDKKIGSKIGPVETEFHFPQIIIPENPLEQVIVIEEVAEPGAYRIEVSSPVEFIIVTPMTVNIMPPPVQ